MIALSDIDMTSKYDSCEIVKMARTIFVRSFRCFDSITSYGLDELKILLDIVVTSSW